MRALTAVAFAAAMAVSASVHADEPADEPAESAIQLFDEAQELYQRGAYRDAIDKLERAVALDPAGSELVYNLALVHERLGEVDEAERYYQKYLEMETDPKAKERVRAVLKRLAGAKRELVKESAPAAPAKCAPDTSLRPLTFAVGASAAAALVIGSSFAIAALVTDPSASDATSAGEPYSALRDRAALAHREAIVADVSFAIGALATAATIYLAVRGHGAEAARPATALRLGPGGAAVVGSF